MSFNPNAPCVAGNEWFVTGTLPFFVKSDADDAGTLDVLIESTATETVDSIWVFLDSGNTALERLAREGWYTVDIYDASNLGTTLPTTSTYDPSADTSGTGAYSANQATMPFGGSVTADLVVGPTFWDKVDNGESLVQGLFNGVSTYDADWVTVTDGTVGFFSCYFGNIIGTLNGEQILSVRLIGIADVLGSASGVTFRPFLLRGPRADDGVESISGKQPAGGHRLFGEWFADPLLFGSWEIDGVEDFDDANSAAAAGFVMDGTGDNANYPAIYSMFLEVLHRPEVRHAWGSRQSFVPGWNEIPLTRPGGASGWLKNANSEYLLTLRRRGGTTTDGGLLIPLLLAEQPHTGARGVSVGFSGLMRAPTSVGALTAGGPGLLLDIGGGAMSADSQPYTSEGGDDLPDELYADDLTIGYVHGVDPDTGLARTAAQKFTAGQTDNYSYVRVLVRAPLALPDEPLEVRITDALGASVLAGPLYLDAADLEAPITQFQVLADFLPAAAALTNGTSYRILLSSQASVDTPWEVQVLTVGDANPSNPGIPPPGTTDVTFGGSTNSALFNDVADTKADLCVTLAISETAPTGLTALATAEIMGVSTIELDWNVPTLACGDFGEYQLDRSEDGGTTWFRIANISDQSVNQATDLESLRNVAATYRIRVVRADGTPSPWSAATPGVTATLTECGYLFASNWAPDLAVWYDDLEHRSYAFLDDDETVDMKLSGRPMSVSFHSLEYRGEQLTPTLLIAAKGGQGGTEETLTPGVTTFDPLRELAGKLWDRTSHEKTFVPYIAVMSAEGDRWFARVKTPKATRHEPDGAYMLDVDILEVTAEPAPFDLEQGGS